jgi:hypothetical protein
MPVGWSKPGAVVSIIELLTWIFYPGSGPSGSWSTRVAMESARSAFSGVLL